MKTRSRVAGAALLGLLLSAPAQSALVYDWFITNPDQTVSPTDVVTIEGRIVNDITSDPFNLDTDITQFVGSFSTSGEYTPKFGQPVGFWPAQFSGVILAPGESFDFIFATLTPSPGPVAPGLYGVMGAGLTINGDDDRWQVPHPFNPEQMIDGFAKVTVEDTSVPPPAVPLPAAVWLFGTALLGLLGLRRKV